MTKITFTNIFPNTPFEEPKPASRHVPDWYKETESYIGGEKKPWGGRGATSATVKKCVPVFDAITAGYMITTPVDVFVSQRDGAPYFEWPSLYLEFHPVEQAPLHPAKNGFQYPKYMNPWAIETPKGYSCLFVQPFHRESPITILPGVVDTDQYVSAINFPFVLTDVKWEGLIPAGMPLAQVIPFKREAWQHEIGTDTKKHVETGNRLNTQFFDRYRNMFWSRKEFK